MPIFLQDARFAVRQLWKHPGFALTAILSLALGIAATVSVFSVVYSVLLKPLPYSDPDRIVQLNARQKSGAEYNPQIPPNAIQSMRSLHSFEDIVEMDEAFLAETTGDLPDDVDVVYLSGNAFPFFGVPAFLGRTFLPSDAPQGQAPQRVVVLTYQYWQRRFHGDTSIVGQPLRLDGRSYRILGVMPRRFTWWDADVYVPLHPLATDALMPIMRLRPGVSKQTATQESQAIFKQVLQQSPGQWSGDTVFEVVGVQDYILHPLRGVLYVLFAGVALLLGIGCGNVSILLLTRGTARQHEFAVRAAVGASAGRIVRQLLTESLILGLAGAALGVVATYRSTPWVVSLLPWQLFPRGLEIPIHVPVLLFSSFLAILTSVLFGLAPALLLAKPEIREVMQASSKKTAGSVSGQRMHSILIASQIAFAVVLLSAAATAAQSFRTLAHTDLGYDPRHVADFAIPMHPGGYTTGAERASYFTQLREKVAQAAGVESAAITLIAPPSSNWDFPIEILGQTPNGSQIANINLAEPEYFSTLRIPLVEGRLWSPAEMQNSARLVVVNKTFARRYFPGQDAIGHAVRLPGLVTNLVGNMQGNSGGWLEIIGVEGDVLNNGVDQPIKPEIYLPYSLLFVESISIQMLVRSQGDPLALEKSVKRQIAAVNPGQQVSYPIVSLTTRLERQPAWARARLVAVLSGVFSSLALALSGVGLFSVVSYNVGQRTHEFGIRMALGAQRRHLIQNVLAGTSWSVGMGLAVGMLLSFALYGVISRYAHTEGRHLILNLEVCVLLLAVSLLACIVPALRASFIHPMKALRTD